MFSDLFESIHFAYIFCAAVLFICGIYTAPHVVDKDLKWLLFYPRWVAGLMEKYFSVNWGFFIIFSIIFTLNNLSLFSGFLSGYLIILPFILTFLTGLHVAVIGYDLMGWKGIWHLLVNPVAWLEFPAAWLSFGMGIKLSVTILTADLKKGVEIFEKLLPLYLKYVMVLLAIAALIETAFIIWAEKQKNK